jgi:hypothetical protein
MSDIESVKKGFKFAVGLLNDDEIGGVLPKCLMGSGILLALPGFAMVFAGAGLQGAFDPLGSRPSANKLANFGAMVATNCLIYAGVAAMAPGAVLMGLGALGKGKEPSSKPKI